MTQRNPHLLRLLQNQSDYGSGKGMKFPFHHVFITQIAKKKGVYTIKTDLYEGDMANLL